MSNTRVSLGPNAYSFNDQSTGITIGRGEIKELTPRQLSNKRIQRALNQGHLRMVLEPKSPEKYTEADIKKLDRKLRKQYDKGIEPVKAADSYSLEEAECIAKLYDIESDANDTAVTLIEAIFESYGENSN